MNIQEMVAALRACADGRCEECPLENEDFTCSRNLWSATAGAVEAMAAELEKLRKPAPEPPEPREEEVPHPPLRGTFSQEKAAAAAGEKDEADLQEGGG